MLNIDGKVKSKADVDAYVDKCIKATDVDDAAILSLSLTIRASPFWIKLPGRGYVAQSFRPYMRHCLTVLSVHITVVQVCKSTKQVDPDVEYVHVHRGPVLPNYYSFEYSYVVMAVVVLEALFVPVVLQGSGYIFCWPIEKSPINLVLWTCMLTNMMTATLCLTHYSSAHLLQSVTRMYQKKTAMN